MRAQRKGCLRSFGAGVAGWTVAAHLGLLPGASSAGTAAVGCGWTWRGGEMLCVSVCSRFKAALRAGCGAARFRPGALGAVPRRDACSRVRWGLFAWTLTASSLPAGLRCESHLCGWIYSACEEARTWFCVKPNLTILCLRTRIISICNGANSFLIMFSMWAMLHISGGRYCSVCLGLGG